MNLKNPEITEAALKWIVTILEKRHIPFAITAGFAAQVYGATRELNDIDIDIPEEHMNIVAEDVQQYLTYGPVPHKDEWWDLPLMTLDYKGQVIDISGAETIKVHNPKLNQWIPCPTDFSKVEKINVFGMDIPFINKDQLIYYKSILALGWPHQKKDVEEMIKR